MYKLIGLDKWGLRGMSVFVLTLILWVSNDTAIAQKSKVELNALISETQRMSQTEDQMLIIWWIPEEYWRVSFEQNPIWTGNQIEGFLKVLRPYTVIAAVDGKIGAFGGMTFKSDVDIRAIIRTQDNEGTLYSPFKEDQIDADIKNFLSMMKPLLANVLGPMGQNIHFFLFPAKKENGQKIADVKSDGRFSVKLGERYFSWRLPLGSLLPQKICSVDMEKLNGAWKYCPWHGVELMEANK